MHDIRVRKDNGFKIYQEIKLLANLGFQVIGKEHANSIMLHKKSKKAVDFLVADRFDKRDNFISQTSERRNLSPFWKHPPRHLQPHLQVQKLSLLLS